MKISEDGNWRFAESRDPVDPELMGPPWQQCLRCGVRVYLDGMKLHDDFHTAVGR